MYVHRPPHRQTCAVCTSTHRSSRAASPITISSSPSTHPPHTHLLSASFPPSLHVSSLAKTLTIRLSCLFGFKISKNLTLPGLPSTRRTRQPSTASSQRQPSAGGPPAEHGCFEASGRTPALSSSSLTDEARRFRRSPPSLVGGVVGCWRYPPSRSLRSST